MVGDGAFRTMRPITTDHRPAWPRRIRPTLSCLVVGTVRTAEPCSTRILVIKLGALGDFVHAFHAFAAIRAHHRDSHVVLLTTPPFQPLGEASPWFDEVRVDVRARWWNLAATWRVARALRRFDLVYDLQTVRRSNHYFNLAGRPPWSGVARGCSLPHANKLRDSMHTLEREREQLQMAGISVFPTPDRAWLVRQGGLYGLTPPYALLVPGGAGHYGAKRWPAGNFAAIAQALVARGVTPVIIGGTTEAAAGALIRKICPAAIDLTGRTTIPDVATIASHAWLAIGNDTGPLHLAASVGTPTVALFSALGVSGQAAPRGPNGEWATVVSASDLGRLPVPPVLDAVLAKLGLGQVSDAC